jgi:hypothetical protein
MGRQPSAEYYQRRSSRRPRSYAYVAVLYCVLGLTDGRIWWFAVAAIATVVAATMLYRDRSSQPRKDARSVK